MHTYWEFLGAGLLGNLVVIMLCNILPVGEKEFWGLLAAVGVVIFLLCPLLGWFTFTLGVWK